MRSLSVVLAVALAAAAVVVSAGGTAAAGAVAQPAAAETSTFTPVSPVRVLDTRGGSAVAGGQTITLDLAGRLPADTTAVVLNLTGVAPTVGTYVTAYPAGAQRPTVSSINLAPGETRANLVTVAVGTTRAVSLYNHLGSTHLVADLAGSTPPAPVRCSPRGRPNGSSPRGSGPAPPRPSTCPRSYPRRRPRWS